MMIRKLLLASLIAFTGLLSLMAQNPVHVYGTVINANGGGQDSVNLLLSVYYVDSTFCQAEAWTGVDGTYDVTLPCASADPNILGFVQVNMIDCNNLVQSLFFTTANGIYEFEANFSYCQNNNSDSCLVIILEQPNPGASNYLTAWTPPGQSVSYLWSTGEITQDIYPAQEGNYCVTVTLAPFGCTVSDCYYYVGDSTSNCFAYIISTPLGNNLYNLEAIGSGTAPLTYAWNNGPPSTSQYLQAVPPGTYCVVVTDAEGCSYETCIIVPDNNFCEAYIYADPSGALTANGYGLPPVTYLWSTGDTVQTIYPQVTGLYCVTITDANGCQASSCYDTGFPTDSCYTWVSAYMLDSTTFVVQAFPSGFGQSWSYLWNTGDTTDIIYPQDPFQSYCVTVTDNTGCVSTGCYDPTNWCYSWIDLQYVDTTTAVLTAFNDPIFNWPGALSPTYLWSTGDTTAVITTDSSGEYCVTVTLGTGCTAEACTTVDFEGLSTDCSAWVWQYPDSTNSQWLAQVYAWGWGTFSYQWSTGDTTDVIALAPNTYACVTVTSSLGCESVACVDSFYNPCTPVISIYYISNTEAILSATGINDPNQGGTFVWNTGDSSSVITVNASGTYCVTATGGGCTGEACINVFFGNPCSVTINAIDTIGGTLFWANAAGTPPFTYSWDNGATSSYLFDQNGNADHCVTVTDAVGCISTACSYLDSCSAYIYLSYLPNPTLQVVANYPITYCEWNTGNPGDTMLWLLITDPGTYCATLTTAFGCTSTTCITVDSLNPVQGSSVIAGYVLADTIAAINGRVHAYRVLNNSGEPFEEVAATDIGQGGYYRMDSLEPGIYVIKADFFSGSSEELNFIPTYHVSSTTWETADMLVIPNFLTVTTDIKLVNKTPHNGGGVIGGAVTDPNHILAGVDADFRNLTGLNHVTVLLNDYNGQPFDFVYSDEDGNFRFVDLPYGTYRLSFDLPGLTSPDIWVTISADDPEKLNVTLIAENGSVAVKEPDATSIQLYPNPAKDQINMIVPGSNAIYEMQVLDMQGRIVYAGSARNYNGILSIDISRYTDGLYHINLLNETHRFYGRFIKQE